MTLLTRDDLGRRFLVIMMASALLALAIGCGKSQSGERQTETDVATAETPADGQSAAESADNSAVSSEQSAENNTPAGNRTTEKTPTETAQAAKQSPRTDPNPPVKPKPRQKTPRSQTAEIPAGMNLVIELGEDVETGQIKTGDSFSATLVEPVIISEKTIFAKSAPVTGYVLKAVASGRLKTDAELALRLTEVDGVAITTDVIEDKAASHKDRNKKLIGGGAIVGGIIGAVKGKDVKGAVVGAAAGAAAGTGAAVLTGKKNLKYEAGMLLQFTLSEPVKVEVK
ncbi:MAG: hypothetical protein ACE5GA_02000 [Candidatus Zixiibacteriota bacterium]